MGGLDFGCVGCKCDHVVVTTTWRRKRMEWRCLLSTDICDRGRRRRGGLAYDVRERKCEGGGGDGAGR